MRPETGTFYKVMGEGRLSTVGDRSNTGSQPEFGQPNPGIVESSNLGTVSSPPGV